MTTEDQKTISIITANAGYTRATGHAALRQKAISLILNDDNAPALVLFQEFDNTKFDVTSPKWKSYNISNKYGYLYKGNDASFLYHKDKLTLEDVDDNQKHPEWKDSLIRIREELRNKDQRLELALGRMPMAVAKMVNDEQAQFACVSYHGPSSVSDDAKWLEIEGMLMLVTTWSKQMNLPLIIGGDFNLEFLNVSAHLEKMGTKLSVPVIAHNYKAEGKRERSLKVDFFIASALLELKEIYPINWNEHLGTEILDHDPVTAKLRINSLRTHRQINSFKEEVMKKTSTEDIKNEVEEEIKKNRHDFEEEIKTNIRDRIAKHAYKEKIKEKYEKEIEEEIRKGMMKIDISDEIKEDIKRTMKKKIAKDITDTMKVARYRKETPIGAIDQQTIEKIKKTIETEELEKAKKNIKVEIQEKIEEEIDKEIIKDIKKHIKKDIEEEMKKEVTGQI